jgi:hypothetical protein
VKGNPLRVCARVQKRRFSPPVTCSGPLRQTGPLRQLFCPLGAVVKHPFHSYFHSLWAIQYPTTAPNRGAWHSGHLVGPSARFGNSARRDSPPPVRFFVQNCAANVRSPRLTGTSADRQRISSGSSELPLPDTRPFSSTSPHRQPSTPPPEYNGSRVDPD